MTGAEWIFDELPPSGARRGGDPSEHAFQHQLDTFVREVIQNANDQAIGTPEVSLRFAELEGDALGAFLEAMSWRTLEPHLRAAARMKRKRGLARFLGELDAGKRMLVLHVEDRNTVGLEGAEAEEDSHFRALCKDTLFSHKQSKAAGGSYGLGKSVLWGFSGLSTVLFNSTLRSDPRGHRSPRLIGRTELPSHAIEGDGQQWYTGSGWFGREARVGHGRRAESVWGDDAQRLADALWLRRSDKSGTSILIVGFRDPASDEEESPRQLAQRVKAAAAKWFWPAMVSRRGLRVTVGAGGRETRVRPEEVSEIQPFLECLEGMSRSVATLSQPGDVAVRKIDVELPDMTDGTRAHRGQVTLCVRLAPDTGAAQRGLVGTVAMYRKPAMVVRYWDRSRVTLGLRPFHAVLICGEARSDRPSAGDTYVEQFLRAAEPPGHDEWKATPALKDQYKKGYAKALKVLEDRVTEELKHLLAPQPHQGERGPDRLRRRFPIGTRGGTASETESAFHFSGLSARFEDNTWRFEGEMRPARARRKWTADVRLVELGDDGAVVDEIAVASLDAESGEVQVVEGVGSIRVDGGQNAVRFVGTSARRRGALVGELSLEVTGRLLEEES